MQFKEFPKIQRLNNAYVVVTQKLHGTNASVWITRNFAGELEIRAARRNDFLTLEKDNYGFAAYVDENRQAFIDLLGEGVHYGEWCGPKINSGEGLTEKRFFLFEALRWADKPLPPRCSTVPVLFYGKIEDCDLPEVLGDLKEKGSRAVPGFMRPEGIVVHFLGTNTRFKEVFEAEETQWKQPSNPRPAGPSTLPDVNHLLQPIRLEKLLSRDEAYLREMPASLPRIVSDYVRDLEVEQQFSTDPDEEKLQKRALGKIVFKFAKALIEAA